MRFTICAVAILLGACADHPARASDVAFRIPTEGIRVETSAGRVELRRRVVEAIGRFCAARGAEISPAEMRDDPRYCPDMARSWAMGEMTPDLRHAYVLARREAKVQGSAP